MNLVIVAAGLLSCALLFILLKRLPAIQIKGPTKSFSVIIPARDEESTLSLLLEDISKQTIKPDEIICVDDESTDATAKIAKEGGARVVQVSNKPDDWTGKTYACQKGARVAMSELLLFLDADVRLAPTAFETLLAVQETKNCTVSVQPSHITKKWYEQLSLFFNLITAASLGSRCSLGFKTPGLYGPVILMKADDYERIHGHESVKGDILEDIGLGEKLSNRAMPYCCFVGGPEIQFRMYSDGPRSLVEGWTKNFASGAMRSSLLFVVLVTLWMAAMCIIPFEWFAAAVQPDVSGLFVYSAAYVAMVGLLSYSSFQVGRFKVLAVVFYPVCLAFFLVLFVWSFFKKIFHRPVQWKGRKIEVKN